MHPPECPKLIDGGVGIWLSTIDEDTVTLLQRKLFAIISQTAASVFNDENEIGISPATPTGVGLGSG